MPYTAQISRTNPVCVLVLIDQSKAMAGPFGGGGAHTRSQWGAKQVNRWLYSLAMRCISGSTVLDRFHVGVIGYGEAVDAVLGGPLAGRALVPISEIACSPLRVEQVDGVRSPVWVEPAIGGGAPLCKALRRAATRLAEWVLEYPDSFPPLIVNFTSGESTDGDPSAEAERVRALATSDGNVLLCNVHVSGREGLSLEFPDREESLPEGQARRLFAMSSVLPPGLRGAVGQAGFSVGETTRGFACNADLTELVRSLDVGSRVDALGSRPAPSRPAAPRPVAPAPPPTRPAARPASQAPRPAEDASPLAFDRLYDVRCHIGDKLVTYTGVRLAGVTSGLAVRDGPLFDRWLILESPAGRKVFVPPQAVVAIEEHARSDAR